MDDLIRREDAFSYFVTLWECIGTIMDKNEWEDVCMTTANEIPPAQPEIKTDGDTISRQAAKLKVARVIWEDGDSCYDFHDKCVDCLDDVPSAQPEIIHCRGCKHRGEKPISDGRYWCDIHDTFMYYCSDAERRTDEGD